MWQQRIPLTNVVAVMAGCCSGAELGVARMVRNLPRPTEEEITALLALELRREVEAANAEERFSSALLADVRAIIGNDFVAARMLRGLVARVDFHDRHHEGRSSAADLGIMVVRPVLALVSGSDHIRIAFNEARALLVQAKLGQMGPRQNRFKWGSLTPTQDRLIPKRRSYFSFLLYRIRPQAVDVMEPISWQLCANHTLKDMRSWLATDKFPAQQRTLDIVRQLAEGSIGTDDAAIIGQLIAPRANRRIIEFRVDWPDDSRPPGVVRLQTKATSGTKRLEHHRRR